MVSDESTQMKKKTSTPPPACFFVIMLLGLWLITAPGTFHFESSPLIYSDLICGILLLCLAILGRRRPSAAILWTLAGIGIWLQCAPLLFWAPTAGGYLNNVLIGALVITVSVLLFPLPKQVPDEEPTIPPGWTYNPSSWPQRLPLALFAFFCWMIAKYLAARQLGYIDTVWDPFFDPGTEAVLTSSVSQWFPVSDAGLGALAYTLEFLLTCQGGKARWRTSPWGVLVFGILAVPVSLVSVILIILQPLIVGTWCTLCLLTAVCMLVPIPLAIDEVIASLQYLKRTRGKTLFKGGKDPRAKIDTRTPTLSAPLHKIMQASLWGVTFPWNLSVSALAGICLMALPSVLSIEGILFDMDPILGALVVMVAVVAYSEWLRSARYLNILCAGVLFIVSGFSSTHILLHLSIAIVIGALSLRRGSLKELHADHSL